MDLVLIRPVAFALDWVVQLAVLVLPQARLCGYAQLPPERYRVTRMERAV